MCFLLFWRWTKYSVARQLHLLHCLRRWWWWSSCPKIMFDMHCSSSTEGTNMVRWANRRCTIGPNCKLRRQLKWCKWMVIGCCGGLDPITIKSVVCYGPCRRCRGHLCPVCVCPSSFSPQSNRQPLLLLICFLIYVRAVIRLEPVHRCEQCLSI